MEENGIIMLSGLKGCSQHGSGDMLASEESPIYHILSISVKYKQVNRNATKDKSTDSSKHKKMAKARNDLAGGQSRGRSKKQK
jgi:hypothetical protein